MKKCGRQYGIPSDQVLARVRQQEEEHARLIEAGVVPPEQNRYAQHLELWLPNCNLARPTIKFLNSF